LVDADEIAFRACVRITSSFLFQALMYLPMQVPKLEQPTHEQVSEHLQAFINELQALFDRHKSTCGCDGVQLRVM
jgi:hypothetical protein